MFSRLTAVVWRHIPRGAHPLDLGYILRASGRWNRPGIYGALYTALTREGAIAELEKSRAAATPRATSVNFSERDVVALEVSVDPVLDLTDASTIATLKTDVTNFLGDDDNSIEACRTVADFARSNRYRAILVPSAAAIGEKNLVIFVDIPSAELTIRAGNERLTIP